MNRAESMTWEKNVRKAVPYVPGEQPSQVNMIKLNTNENPYPPAPGLEKALKALALESLRLYPDPTSSVLVEALAKRFGLGKDQVFVGVGSDDVLAMAFLAFFNGGKAILFPDITYSFYDVWAKLYGIPYECPPLNEDFSIQPEDYFPQNQESGEIGGIVLANPNAPTGLSLGLPRIRKILENNPGCIVIVDEAYIDFGGESAVDLLSEFPNLLVVQTFSKSRSLAGMRIGYGLAQPALIQYLNDVKYSFNSYTMSRAALSLGAKSVEEEGYFRSTVGKVIETRERVATALGDMGFVFPKSDANFIFASHPKVEAEVLLKALREKKIYVRHFKSPERIRDYLRISIGTNEEMDVFLAFVKEYIKACG